MPLPNLEQIVPHFEVIIPSTGQAVQFRPFLVKEEKLLLIALQTEDERQMLDAIVQVVTSCALSPIKVDDLANFDIEHIFLQLRSASVDPVVELNYRCHNKVELTPEEAEKRRIAVNPEGPTIADCDNVVKIKVVLDEVKVKFSDDHQKQIFLTETLGVNMRYPNFKMAKQLLRATGAVTTPKDNVNDALTTIALCIESVFDDKSVYNNFTPKEIQDWVEKLTQAQFVKLQKFFESIPKLAHDTQFRCPKCGYTEPLHIEGLASFFG